MNGGVIAGYEEERLSGIKSDSAFPERAIRKLVDWAGGLDGCNVYVSHWFTDGQLPESNKYWKPEVLFNLVHDAKVYSFHSEFTHHDAHMFSAKAFAGEAFPKKRTTLVMDGFGTHGECISIYRDDVLFKRFFGYHNSLGLFYQYATAACGMKMNNHEYKMLAYETHIREIFDEDDMVMVDKYIDKFSETQWHRLNSMAIDPLMDPMVDVAALTVQGWVTGVLYEYLSEFNIDKDDVQKMRIAISYFAQRHIENMVIELLDTYCNNDGIDNVIFAGGLALNVKLNNIINQRIDGKFCVMPLAGDQGAGLGVYEYYNRDLVWPGHLNWGPRDYDMELLATTDGIIICDEADAKAHINNELARTGLVNIIRGNMEFGPRALCNTTTLAFPNTEVASRINSMNKRTNEMPFAMVMSQSQLMQLFFNHEKIHESLQYMICAVEFRTEPDSELRGGAHYYPLTDDWTCRPQVTSDPFMVDLLKKNGPLINTSFNFHGVPIVCTTEQIVHTHLSQRNERPDLDIKTLIIMR
jgi:predicted NodU family carbamoyl transferase